MATKSKRHLSSLLAVVSMSLALPACQSLPPMAASGSHIGSFVLTYAGGNTYRVDVPDDASIKWECLAGDE
jgi:hypothetical protein